MVESMADANESRVANQQMEHPHGKFALFDSLDQH